MGLETIHEPKNKIMIPKQVEVLLQSPVSNSFRCKMAANSLDIDVEKKSVHHLKIDGINLPDGWKVGIIYGASGSGKTTLAKKLFGEDIFATPLDNAKPIIEQFPASFKYDECAAMLNGIGLTSVPCWIRPVYTLSNGQRARAEAALLMSRDGLTVIDEWTSVVDRTVAKAMSHCVQKHARRANKQIILLSCHHDIIEWVKPDWVIDCNKQEFQLPASADFFFQEREKLEFTIRPVSHKTWRQFSKYHYLSERLPGGKIYCYGLFLGDEQIGFNCFANYTPIRPGTTPIFHANRAVVHPDYCGLGLGIKLLDISAQHMKDTYKFRIMTKYSSTPVFRAMIKAKKWKFLGEKRVMGKTVKGGMMQRVTGFRDGGIKTYQFEYIG